MRTFHRGVAKVHSIWAVDVSGVTLTVTSGRVGSSGQTFTRTFPTPEDAETAAEELIGEKTAKGYAETTPPPDWSDAWAFERKLLDDPSDRNASREYADYLSGQHDPRGEFMRVQLDLEDAALPETRREALRRREQSLQEAHERAWVGPLAAVTLDGRELCEWKGSEFVPGGPPLNTYSFARGWLSRVGFGSLTVAGARALAASPAARLLRELVVERVEEETPVGTPREEYAGQYEPGPDVPPGLGRSDEPGLYALLACPHLAAVRRYQFGTGEPEPDAAGAGTSTAWRPGRWSTAWSHGCPAWRTSACSPPG